VELVSDYNASAYTAHAVEEKIVHFAGFKQNDFPYMRRFRNQTWPKGIQVGKAKVTKLGEKAEEKTGAPMFSVIIPAFNAENRIRRLLNSIVSQTFRDYEIIVVCDSCKDTTEKIAKAYGAKTCRVKYGNDGLTRDRGIELASGDWVLFADDDDWFRTDRAFEMLADFIAEQEETVDVIGFGYMSRLEGNMHPSEVRMFVAGSAHVWSSCWKRERIGDARFGNRVFCSDAYFMRDMRKNIRKYALLDEPLYYYNLMRPGSQTDLLNKGLLIKEAEPENVENIEVIDEAEEEEEVKKN
jgi:glycosyltransferase involved in cell wall biosynthesis